MILLRSLYFMMPLLIGGFLHALVIKKDYLRPFAKPIDLGLKISGKPVFGKNKTFRGFLVYITTSAIFLTLQAALYRHGELKSLALINYNAHNSLLLGSFLGFLNSFAELPNSFIKRQFGVGSGGSNTKWPLAQYLVDQIDAPLVISLVLYVGHVLTLPQAFTVFALGSFIHGYIDQTVYYRRGIKSWPQSEAPWLKPLIILFQLFCFPVLLFLIYIVFRGRVERDYPPMQHKPKRLVIFANHQRALDPMLVAAAFRPMEVLRLLPVRFITANVHYYNPVKHLFFIFAGGFPAHENKRKEAYGIDRARYLLDQAQTILIFPEGIRTEERLPAKRGVWEMSKDKDTLLLPVRLQWSKSGKLISRLSFRMGKTTTNHAKNADQLMDNVYDLKLNK